MITQLKHLKKLQSNLENICQKHQEELIENQNQLNKYQQLVTSKLSEDIIIHEVPMITLEHFKNRLPLNSFFKSYSNSTDKINLSKYHCVLDLITFTGMDFFWFWSLVTENLQLNTLSVDMIHQYLDIYFLENYTCEDFSKMDKPKLKSWNSNFNSLELKIHHLKEEFQIQINYESLPRQEKIKNYQLERDFWIAVLKSENPEILPWDSKKAKEWLANLADDMAKLNLKKSEDLEKMIDQWIQKKELSCEIEIYPEVLENFRIRIREMEKELERVNQYLVNQKRNKIIQRNKSLLNLKKQCGNPETDIHNYQIFAYWENLIPEKEYVLKLKLQEIKNLKQSNLLIDKKIDNYQIETYDENHLLYDRIHKITQDLQNTKNQNLEKIKENTQTSKNLSIQIKKFKKYLEELKPPKNTHISSIQEINIIGNENKLNFTKLQNNLFELQQLESNYHHEYLNHQKKLEKLEKNNFSLVNKFIEKDEFIWLGLEKKRYIIQKILQLEKQIDTYCYLEAHQIEKKVMDYQNQLQNITAQLTCHLELENKHPDTSKILSDIQRNMVNFIALYFWILVLEDLNIPVDWNTWNMKHYRYFLNLDLQEKFFHRKIREHNHTNRIISGKQKLMMIKSEIDNLNHFRRKVNENEEKMVELEQLNSYLKSIYVYILNT